MAGPLLSTSWYRVAERRPALRSHARLSRHRYRGEVWYLLQDPASSRVHRFTPAARRARPDAGRDDPAARSAARDRPAAERCDPRRRRAVLAWRARGPGALSPVVRQPDGAALPAVGPGCVSQPL